ncbi:hypothetical protein CRENBAI_017887 [Crenichthys baileyi]|uniref:Uncharacterized protein n=1 Tax=Crenichthys baileyi TaxID=28760 RepID=A0AAV9RCG4_9TELE
MQMQCLSRVHTPASFLWCKKKSVFNNLFKGISSYNVTFILYNLTEKQLNWRHWCSSAAVIGLVAGYTLDRSPVHHRATQRQTEQTTAHTDEDNVERPISPTVIFLLQYLERTHASTGRNHADFIQ